MAVDDIDALVAELLLEAEDDLLGEDESMQELFLKFLMMKLTMDQLRRRGLSYYEILELCREIDVRRSNGSQRSSQNDLRAQE